MKIVDMLCTLMLLIVVLVAGSIYLNKTQRQPLRSEQAHTSMREEVKVEKKGHIARELCPSFECMQKRTE